MNSKIIIYDDNCPLCTAYTGAFVKTGLLDKEGRKSFSSIDENLLSKIDIRRSVNEIPLIDTQTKQVWYGIDALLEILQQKLPAIKVIGNIPPVKWLLQKLYKFISYNRRVIVAGKNKNDGFDCSPAFNTRYRLLFLAVFLTFNTLMLFPLQEFVLGKSIFNSNIVSLQLAHTLFVCINICIGLTLQRIDTLEYLGQINMIALVAMLFCVPLIIINRYVDFDNGLFNTYYLGMLTVLVVHEYFRRMRYIGFTERYRRIMFINIACLAFFLSYLIIYK